MKHAFAVVVAVLAVAVGASAQYNGSEPAPSMYAAQAGGAMPQAYGPIMYGGAQPNGAFMAGMPPAAAFVEQQQQQQQQQQAYAPFPQEMEEEEQGELAEAADEAEAENEAAEEVESESSEEAEMAEGQEADSEMEAETEEDGMRFQETRGPIKRLKKKVKKLFRKAKRKGKRAVAAAKKFLKKLVGGGKKKNGKKGGKKGKVVMKGGARKPKAPNSWFKPTVGKKKNKLTRTPGTKTPKSAGGKPLPPMPAPLPVKPKINCKKNPQLCIEAETPADGEEPGDHSPKAVFKKKMEVIRKALLKNNRNIAQEAKWIDQVDAIMKQYKLKSRKVKEHISDERKAIKELLRQRRIVLNEKKQKELELKLKISTTELSALTEALSQVQKKEKELGAGKTTLGSKIKLLADDLKALRKKHAADKKQSIIKH